MRAIAGAVLGLVMILSIPAPAATQEAGALLDQLRDDSGDRRLEAARELGRLGAEVIGPLAEMLGGEDQRLDLAARLAVQAVVHHAAAPDGAQHREAVAKALADIATSERPAATRAFAVRQLSFVGGDEVLPVMWDLLMFRPDMHEIARWALARMPSNEAAGTLKRATFEVGTPERTAGILDALATRATIDTYPIAAKALEHESEIVRIAGLNLLGRIADPAGAELIRDVMKKGSDAERKAAAKACVRLGDTLYASGKVSSARSIFEELARSDDPTLAAAGVAGIGRVGGPGAAFQLFVRLKNPDPGVRGAAQQGLIELPGEDVTKAIAGAIRYSGPDAPAPRRLFIHILGERGDPVGRAALLQALGDDSDIIRAEAVRALGKMGDTNRYTARAIVDAVSGGSDELLAAAEWALNRIPGDDVTEAIAKLCSDENAHVREVLVRALGNRGGSRTFPTHVPLAALEDEDERVRLAAIGALERLRDPATVGALIAAFERGGPEAEAAGKALSRFASPDATSAMIAAFEAPDTTPLTRAGVLAALAPREDAELIDTFLSAAKDKDDQVAVAALEALGRLRDDRAAPVFLARIEDGTSEVRRAAVRGYLGIAEAREQEDGAASLAIYKEALAMEVGDDEKRQALQGLGRLADVESLASIEPYLDNEQLKGAAAGAVLPIARKLREAGENDRAIELCRRCVDASKDRNVIRDAAKCLRELGVDLQIAAQRGCIINWWVLGPFPGRERATKNDFVPTDARIDPAQTVKDEDRELEWKYSPVDDPLGMIDFEKTVARMDNCGCYAYAEVESDAERDVLLKFGSDDSVFCWLNGEQVHAWDGNRGWGEDQDTVKAHIRTGTNTVLCKVINGGAQWSLSLRITDEDGKPILLKQRTE